jgi:kynurenine--oxoglutarate transaminase/cysteine-S-conjugate beta-lyase/glutamine--phenylpyruvate transaminase
MSIPYLVDKVKETVSDPNVLLYQYTRSAVCISFSYFSNSIIKEMIFKGHQRLINGIANVYSKFLEREIDPLTNVLVTNGAYGSLFNAISSFLNPGDEMIIIEPFFDCYAPMAVQAQAKCVYVPLKPKNKDLAKNTVTTTADWGLDDEELEAAFTPKTKILLINTPNNPLGKVYTKEELEKIAKLCIKYNCICISDEVYEHITYDNKHIRIATLPGMWERTVTIGSAGKTFSSTGAKV